MKKRTTGQILLEMEPLLQELVGPQGCQWSDVLALVHIWLMVHAPQAREEYTEGGYPEFYYGPERRNK